MCGCVATASESTNSRVLWWSVVETFSLVAMSLAQIFYLRRYAA